MIKKVYNYTIFLKITYYEIIFLNRLIKIIISIIKKIFIKSEVKISLVNLPKRSNLITVLRSPHIFKTSREQFKQFVFNQGILLNINKKNNFLFLYFFLLKFLKKTNCYYNFQVNINL